MRGKALHFVIIAAFRSMARSYFPWSIFVVCCSVFRGFWNLSSLSVCTGSKLHLLMERETYYTGRSIKTTYVLCDWRWVLLLAANPSTKIIGISDTCTFPCSIIYSAWLKKTSEFGALFGRWCKSIARHRSNYTRTSCS